MENFKNNFYSKKDGREVISNIFSNEGRTAFSKKVEKTFNWSRKGGPKIGTQLFIKDIIGRVNLTSEEFSILNREIRKEINRLKKEKKKTREENILNKNKLQKQKIKDDNILKGAKKHLEEELKRSGGVDPNVI